MELTKKQFGVYKFVSSDRSRPSIQNVYVEPGTGRVVATDGTALVSAEKSPPGAALNPDKKPAFIPPEAAKQAVAVKAIRHTDAELLLLPDGSQALNIAGTIVPVLSEHKGEHFPDYEKFWPKRRKTDVSVLIDGKKLSALLAYLSPDDKNHPVRLTLAASDGVAMTLEANGEFDGRGHTVKAILMPLRP